MPLLPSLRAIALPPFRPTMANASRSAFDILFFVFVVMVLLCSIVLGPGGGRVWFAGRERALRCRHRHVRSRLSRWGATPASPGRRTLSVSYQSVATSRRVAVDNLTFQATFHIVVDASECLKQRRLFTNELVSAVAVPLNASSPVSPCISPLFYSKHFLRSYFLDELGDLLRFSLFVFHFFLLLLLLMVPIPSSRSEAA